MQEPATRRPTALMTTVWSHSGDGFPPAAIKQGDYVRLTS